eukprot:TRINITY_DN5541_c0_g1_i1.p1 TRINITY_DN5541_c0_g1~~TRINITY_DN5541_c0_g1_i1.p1  ORF type:complete len:572 (-),score=83.54 TRINITY_DN5541_c0_g1_i1:859-2337(-)
MHNPKTDWMYRTHPDGSGLNGRGIAWPRGKVLGGSSSINGLLYIRGQAEDYDEWCDLGNPGWDYKSVLPLFRKSEHQARGEDEHHGVGGPLRVSDLRVKRKICDAFIDSAVGLGVPFTRDFNGPEQRGVGYFQTTTDDSGLRCSSSIAFLHPVQHRPNLTILTNTQTQKLLFDKQNRVTGVLVTSTGTQDGEYLLELNDNESSEVILSSGAIGSPQILELSGIGRKSELERLNITPVSLLEGVGENLQDHLQIRSIYEVTTPTLNDEVASLIRRVIMGIQFILSGTGPLTLAASQVGAFANVLDANTNRPDIQFHIQPLSASGKVGSISALDNFSGFTSSVCQLRPESRGRITLKSRNSQESPEISPNYLSTELDQKCVIAAMKFSRRIMESSPISQYIAREVVPGKNIDTDEELLECARRIGESIYHPVGTCKMGPSGDPSAVVDSSLRVRGVTGLRVADCSIMPNLVSGNTNAPAIMIGEKVSELIMGTK